jgi:hypothetical protein
MLPHPVGFSNCVIVCSRMVSNLDGFLLRYTHGQSGRTDRCRFKSGQENRSSLVPQNTWVQDRDPPTSPRGHDFPRPASMREPSGQAAAILIQVAFVKQPVYS